MWRRNGCAFGFLQLARQCEGRLLAAPRDLDRLRRLDVDGLTPREALELLAELREKVDEKN